jgi:hypothetical protein
MRNALECEYGAVIRSEGFCRKDSNIGTVQFSAVRSATARAAVPIQHNNIVLCTHWSLALEGGVGRFLSGKFSNAQPLYSTSGDT